MKIIITDEMTIPEMENAKRLLDEEYKTDFVISVKNKSGFVYTQYSDEV